MPSARILVVDDDEELLQLLSETLTRDGFRVVTAASAKVALDRAASTSFDLVVCDVHLPGMSGLDLRDEWHRGRGHGDTAFLYISAMDPVVESDLARKLGKDKLVAKPFTRAELRRAVYGALKLSRVAVGPIATTLDRVFLETGDQQGTGVLTAVSGPVSRRVVILEGKAVFAVSNDPRDLIGQAFLRAGVISESDLLEAFALWSAHPESRGSAGLAAALAGMKKVTPEQSRAVFERMIRESILDLYLWRDGQVEFVEGAVAEDEHPFPVALDLAELRREGAARRARWEAANRIVPDRGVRFRRGMTALPAGFPSTKGEDSLLRFLETGNTLAEILVEFRGQDYGIVMRVADLVRRGCFTPAPATGFHAATGAAARYDVTDEFEPFADSGAAAPVPQPSPEPPPDPALERRIANRFAEALVKMRTGDLQGARAGFLEVLASDPFNTLARERLEESEAQITAAARRGGLKDEDRLRLAVPLSTLVGKPISPNDAFALARLAAGSRTVGELIHLSPFPEHEVLEILVRQLSTGVLTRDV